MEFLAQNVRTADFNDPVFKPYVMREMNGVPVAIIGQAFPYTPISQPALFRRRVDLRHPGSGAAEARRGGPGKRRVGGMTYSCEPGAKMGARILDLRMKGKPIDPGKHYKVVGRAPVAEGATGEPAWDVVERYLKDRKTIAPRAPNIPRLIGVEGNPGLA